MIRQIERDDHPLRDDILDLQRSSLAWVSVAMIGVALGFLCVGAGQPQIGTPKIWLVVGSVALVVGVSWFLGERSYGLSALTLSVGTVISIAISATIYSSLDVLFAIPLVLFLCPVLVGHLPTVAIAIGTGVIVWGLQQLGLVPLSGGDLLAIELLSTSSVGFAWIAYRPIQRALYWAWTSSLEERRKTREVRERQAELARVSKSLADACERLEEANLALARAQQAAEEARRLKEEFATAISHELRTPLNLIIGFSEMTVREPTLDEGGSVPVEFRDDVETIYRNACHLSDLVDDVLDLGRLDAHRLALQKEWSRLSSVVNEAVAAVEGLYCMADLALVADMPPDLPLLYVDPIRIRQVLINLLTNAIRYTDVGSVRISAYRDRGEVVVSVTDTGAGIPAADLPYVFESFRQAGRPHRQGGFGIGLTVCKRLIEMHAGAMWATSEQGSGTTFSFSLPVTDNVAAVAAQPSLQLLNRHYLSGAHERAVLVIGSDGEAIRVFQRYLDGYRVHVASTLPRAREIVARGAVESVIIADPSISEDDILELATYRQLQRAPVLRCLLRTAAVSGREFGAEGFLTKPVSIDRLGDSLDRLEKLPQHVVIVDDEPAMTALLERMLQTIVPDCQVATAPDGKQGFAIAKDAAMRGCLDLVLLDLVMPELDGWGFLAEWNADPTLRRIPVVIVSAASEKTRDIVAESSLEVLCSGGLTIADTMRTIRATLDCLLCREMSEDL